MTNYQVIAVTLWSNTHVSGQLSCIVINHVKAYVRENLRYDSFQMSANHRLGLKHGQMPPDAVQVLELAAPRQHWQAIAECIAQIDDLNRPVVKNPRFSMQWAEDWFAQVR